MKLLRLHFARDLKNVHEFSILCSYNEFYCMIDHHNFKISYFIIEIFNIGIMNPKPSVKESSPDINFLIRSCMLLYTVVG